ncbi:MAG: TIGR03862 family flavoprotein [Gammaproteobacteria bacterium]
MSDAGARPRVAVIGGGPAGLMAAEVAAAGGAAVHVYERMPSCGRKFLVAGKGGLNLSHRDAGAELLARYAERGDALADALSAFDGAAIRRWAAGLGVDTFVGSSGRIFPRDLKAAPLLRRWIRRLREQGVEFHLRHRWAGWTRDGALDFETPAGRVTATPDAVVLALGGGSWPRLGSDGAWVATLDAADIPVRPLAPSNCGFECAWSAHLRERFAGAAVKNVRLALSPDEAGRTGEFVLTGYGVEGSLVYAHSAALREAIARDGRVTVSLDLEPARDIATLAARLSAPRGRRSLAEHLRRRLGLSGVRAALLRELADPAVFDSPEKLAAAIKALPLTLTATRPLAEAISSAGGIDFAALDEDYMLGQRPGVFAAGEMLDWEAPTGGYLLTACLATGRAAGRAALTWARERREKS